MARLTQHPEDRITVGHLDDDSLARLETAYRRDLEDIADGHLAADREPLKRVQHRDVVREIDLRAALRTSWLAVDRGCDSYTDFMAAGGLPAVIAGGGLPLGYDLAIRLDRTMFLAGRPHVLAWPDEAKRGSWGDGGGLLLCPPADGETAEQHGSVA